MQPRDDEVHRLVAEWIRKAELDFDAVVRLAADGERFRDIVAFHSQQAVEKYLKAVLVLHQVEFPKSHDIEKLLHLARPAQPELVDTLFEAKWLTPFGVDIRYPGDFPETLPGDAARALELARRVRDAVMRVLGPHLAGGR
jgi:HEPN domain-containing protein